MRTNGVSGAVLAATLVALGGCGGQGISEADGAAGDAAMSEGGGGKSGGGGDDAAKQAAGTGGSPQPAGGSMPGGPPFGGTCTAICIPTAQFSVTLLGDAAGLLSTPFEACRNDECYPGSFDGVPTNRQVKLTPGETWDETQVTLFYETVGSELVLRLSWQLKPYSAEFVDGDHYTLKFMMPSGEPQTLIDTEVIYERYTFCAGDCTRAFITLQETIEPTAGD